MPMDRSKYPDNWHEIARAIKEAAGWRCEVCGAKHGDYIARSVKNPAFFVVSDPATDWWKDAEGVRLDVVAEEFLVGDLTKVIITVHHIGVEKPDGSPGDPEDKMDCRPENLIALCQRDHLLADMPGNLPKRKHTRLEHKRQAQLAAGQGELF